MCSIKRENKDIVIKCNNIILDIEGTTTSITFVKDVLFPYVRNNLEAYVNENWDSEDFQGIVNGLRIQANEDKENKLDGVIEIPENGEKDSLAKAVIENVLWQMNLDSKAKSLKDLQGLIMEVGYKKGELKGHVYEDVEPNIKSWTDLGKSIYIYSSGSVHAQKLLYGHSEKGDLLPYIKGHFDTTVGKKGDAESYKKIIEQISSIPSETVFFTDVPTEARAAKEVGLFAILLSREGNAPLTDEDKTEFQVITSFSEINFENNSKKRKVCTDSDEMNGNKSVESCEVSLELPKEPTNPKLTHQQEDMEVDESSTEEKVCNIENSDEDIKKDTSENKTQQNPSTENGNVDLQTTMETGDTKTSDKETEVIETQVNKNSNSDDALPKEIESDKLIIETDGEHEKNGVKPDRPSPLTENYEKEVDPVTDNNESVILGEKTVTEPTTINESQPSEEKTLQEVNQNKKETSNNSVSENSKNTEKIAQDRKSNGKSQVSEENGDISPDSADLTENKCEQNDTALQNNSDTVLKHSEVQNDKETKSSDGNVEENSQSKQDTSSDMNLQPNEIGKIEEEKTPESNQVSSKMNNPDSVKMTNSSDMDVDEKSCPKENANSVVNLSTNTIDETESNQVSTNVNNSDSIKKSNSSDMEVEEKPCQKESATSNDNLSTSTSDEKNIPESNQESTNVNNSDSIKKSNSSDMEVEEKPCQKESATSNDNLSTSTSDEKNIPESNPVSANANDSVSIKMSNSSDMEVDEKPCHKESATSDDNLSNSTIDEKNVPESNQVSTNMKNPVSIKVTNSSDMEVVEKPCLKESVNSEGNLSNDTIDKKNIPESNQVSTNISNTVSITETNSSDMEVDEKPCQKVSANSDDNLSSKISPLSVPSKDLSKPENIETESVKESSIVSESLDSVSTADLKTNIKNPESLSLKNEPETTDNNFLDDVKSDKKSVVSSEPGIQSGNASQAKELDPVGSNSKSSVEIKEGKSPVETGSQLKEDEKSIPEQAPTEIMETDDINIQSNKENGKICSEDKSIVESCTESKKESTLDNSNSAQSSDLVVKPEIQNQSDGTEGSQQKSTEQCDNKKSEIDHQLQSADQKTIKETNCLNSKETMLDSDIKNGISEDGSNHMNGKEEAETSVNGKVDDVKSVECSNEKDLKDGSNETVVCEVKKCEVPENATIETVMEA